MKDFFINEVNLLEYVLKDFKTSRLDSPCFKISELQNFKNKNGKCNIKMRHFA